MEMRMNPAAAKWPTARGRWLLILAPLVFAWAGCTSGLQRLADKAGHDMAAVRQGQHLVMMHGCNDCHTPGYLMSGGDIPVDQWLVGSHAVLEGPWGKLYPTNLRLLLDGMTQAQWLGMAKHVKATPMMPWSRVRDMSDDDLAAIYQFVRYLGPKGEAVPSAIPPG